MFTQSSQLQKAIQIFVLILTGCQSSLDGSLHELQSVHIKVIEENPNLKVGSELHLDGNRIYIGIDGSDGGAPALPEAGIVWRVEPAGSADILKGNRVKFLQAGSVVIIAEYDEVRSNTLNFLVQE